MSAIYFKLNAVQESELQILMEKEGFTSRAGFFRFLIKFYKYHQSSPTPVAHVPAQTTNAIKADEAPTHLASDANLSPTKQRLLNNPLIYDEEIRQLIRDLDE